MKKLFIFLLLMATVTVQAAPEQYRMGWDTYTTTKFSNTLVYVECKTGTDLITPYETLPEFEAGIPPNLVMVTFTYDIVEGQTVQCRGWRTGRNIDGTLITAARSGVVSYEYPLTIIPTLSGMTLDRVVQ